MIARPSINTIQFVSVSSSADDATASDAPSVPAEAVATNSSSCGDVKESSISTSDYNGIKLPALVTAYGLSRKSCPLSRVAPGPQDSIPEAGMCGFDIDINSIPDIGRRA